MTCEHGFIGGSCRQCVIEECERLRARLLKLEAVLEAVRDDLAKRAVFTSDALYRAVVAVDDADADEEKE